MNYEAFGRTLHAILVQQHGQEAADKFVNLLITPTLPGSPVRAEQDKAWANITRRLGVAAG